MNEWGSRLVGPHGTEVVLRVHPAMLAGSWPWESQVGQYPAGGAQGISYFAGKLPTWETPIDCLLHYEANGELTGILNHFPVDFPPYEEAGNVLVLVRPDVRGQGIGTQLVDEADRRWGPLPFGQQRYSADGLVFAERWLVTRKGYHVARVPRDGATRTGRRAGR